MVKLLYSHNQMVIETLPLVDVFPSWWSLQCWGWLKTEEAGADGSWVHSCFMPSANKFQNSDPKRQKKSVDYFQENGQN